MIVSLSGIDGSGKTTQAQYVTNLLQREGQGVLYIHMIQWTLVNRLGRLIQGANMVPAQTGKTPQNSGKFTLMRQLVSLLDIVHFNLFAAYQANVRHRIIVCDRFFYDLGIQALYSGTMHPSFEHIYWRLIPASSISILLDLPPDIAQQREGEHPLAYYQAKRDLYLKYAPLWRATVVNATEVESTQKSISQILKNYFGDKQRETFR